MGCTAEIITFGQYNKRIADFLMYPRAYYSDCNKYLVIGYICDVNSTTESQELAEIFGMELWDFTTHIKKNPTVDIERLLELLNIGQYGKEADDMRNKIKLFIELEFYFILQP